MSPANGGLSHIEAKGNVAGGYCVDLTDLSYLSLALLGDLELTDEQKEQGDVDNDGVLTIADLAKLRQFVPAEYRYGKKQAASKRQLVL